MTVDMLPEDEARREASEQALLDDPIRLLIADDDDQTTMVLRDSLPAFGFEVVGSARNGAEAGEKVAYLRPEVVLMDMRMPEVDGIEATVLIKSKEPRTQVVILTAFSENHTRLCRNHSRDVSVIRARGRNHGIIAGGIQADDRTSGELLTCGHPFGNVLIFGRDVA